jgi:DNA mismatch endonuclease (patch repair protein)
LDFHNFVMVDVVAPEVRSRMMSLIRGQNTKPEQLVRRGLWALGFRFRLHAKELPGRPDLVLPKWHTAIFVNGCFWHAHANCRFFRIPASRPEFWGAKLAANARRDSDSIAKLQGLGWDVVTIWECALRRDPAATVNAVAGLIRERAFGSCHVELRDSLSEDGSVAISRR